MKTNKIGTSIELTTRDIKLYQYQIKDRLSLKPFSFKVMTIFVNHDFQKMSGI